MVKNGKLLESVLLAEDSITTKLMVLMMVEAPNVR